MPLTVKTPKCVRQSLADALVHYRRLCSSAWKGQPVNTFLGVFPDQMFFFSKSLDREFECQMLGDISNGFSDTTEMASCVICPLELPSIKRLESL